MSERARISHSMPSLTEIEESAGIRKFITSTPGIGGRIKEKDEDFRVEEVLNLKLSKDGGYLIIRVEKRNWETLNFVRVLSNVLGISRKRIGFAGTKDKKAVTVQYFSISKTDERIERRLSEINLKDARIEIVGRATRGIDLGDLIGNLFTVVVDGIESADKIEEIAGELNEKGVPNYFGLQRFGTLRLITHEVGKQIVLKNYSEAFWTYVAKPSELEDEETRKIREDLWNERDPVVGLRELPKYLIYERTLLQKLREGKSELHALLSLPKSLKLMFIHAYQSYLFNLLLSARIEEFGTLKAIEAGDFADYRQKSGEYIVSADEFSKVTEFNLRRVRFLMERGYAYLSLPLPGYETKLEGWSGEKLSELLESEGVRLEDFRGKYPEFSSRGSFRTAEIPFDFSELSWKVSDSKAVFKFFLPKGCFATVFLREFTKSDHPYFLKK
ncbi:tRNA pseudouridine(13) synthase TruD [Geoglobus sp.]